MQVWNVLHAARWKHRTQKVAKNRHLGTIAQLCRAMSSQLRHVSIIGKNLKQQYLLHMSSQYGELRLTNGWDRFTSLGHSCKFQRASRLDSVTARHSRIGHQPNFAALNRGRHLCSAWRPSRWALAHILVIDVLPFVNVFGRPFVKRFTLYYQTVVCLSYLSVCPVRNVGVLWPNSWMNQDRSNLACR